MKKENSTVSQKEITQKRSEAAKKAWETIRANKLREKRSNAAKKAWETIRANNIKMAVKDTTSNSLKKDSLPHVKAETLQRFGRVENATINSIMKKLADLHYVKAQLHDLGKKCSDIENSIQKDIQKDNGQHIKAIANLIQEYIKKVEKK